MKLSHFIKINTAEMNKESRALFYSLVKDVLGDLVNVVKSTSDDGEPKVTKMFHKIDDNGHWYIIPLKQSPDTDQLTVVTEKLATNLHLGNFQIESSLVENQDIFNNSLSEDEFTIISEKFAQQLHNNWVNERLSQGWRYGERRDDGAKTHPLVKNWSQLSENEKDINPQLVKEFVNILKSNGFKIIKK